MIMTRGGTLLDAGGFLRSDAFVEVMRHQVWRGPLHCVCVAASVVRW